MVEAAPVERVLKSKAMDMGMNTIWPPTTEKIKDFSSRFLP